MQIVLSKMVGFLITFEGIFYGFIAFLSGKAFSNLLSFPISSFDFSATNIQNVINGIIGNGSSYGLLYAFHIILSGLLYPFAFLYISFASVGVIFIWLYSIISFPFSFYPYPINLVITLIFTTLITIAILTSIKIAGSGIE